MSGELSLEGKNAIRAVKMLKRVTRLLERNGIPYLLEAGTLLGVIREDRLLPWDNDLDLTITRTYEKKLLKHLWKLKLFGYKVRVKHYTKDLGYFKEGEVRIVKVWYLNPYYFFRREILLDIFIKRKIGDEYYWTVGLKPPVLKSVPETFYDNLTNHRFRDKDFSVPEDFEGYLECHYGKNWRTPIKEWNFRTDDCNVREILDEY